MNTNGSDRETKGRGQGNEKQQTLVEQIARMSKEFERALPKEITVQRMMRIVMTAIRVNPRLAECTPDSFYGAMLTSLQLGLEVNTPLEHAFLIPRKNGKGVLQCHFEMGYKGLVELCYRTNLYKRIEAEVVYEGDKFDYQYGFNQKLIHLPCGRQEKPLKVWALFELINGGIAFKVWTWDQIMNHAKTFSESFDTESPWKSPWLANPTSQRGMAKKTVLHDALSYAPKSVELARSLNADGNVVIAKPGDESEEGDFSYEVSGNGPPEDEPGEKRLDPPSEEGRVPRQKAPGATQQREPAAASARRNSSSVPQGELLPEDEAEALEEQYRQSQAGVEPPDFT
ncbi:hypothetical protein FACS189447_10260 [Spirochaetia bacterium]|nr:hypothetical protein FACS189447_10260 [Spirochaetia bacterium]